MKTLGAKVNEDTYKKFQKLSEKQKVTVSKSLRNLVEDSINGMSHDNLEESSRLDFHEILYSLIRYLVTSYPVCSDLVCKELERQVHEIVMKENGHTSHCIYKCQLCWLHSLANNLRDGSIPIDKFLI